MAEVKTLKPKDFPQLLKAVRQLLKLPAQKMSIDYDQEAEFSISASASRSAPPTANCATMELLSASAAKRSSA